MTRVVPYGGIVRPETSTPHLRLFDLHAPYIPEEGIFFESKHRVRTRVRLRINLMLCMLG